MERNNVKVFRFVDYDSNNFVMVFSECESLGGHFSFLPPGGFPHSGCSILKIFILKVSYTMCKEMLIKEYS